VTATVFPCAVKVGSQRFAFPQGTPYLVHKQSNSTQALQSRPTGTVQYDFWAFHNLPASIGNMLSGDYGVLTLTVTYLLALLMPLVIGFYLSLSILEDSGYLPRLAVLVDRVLNKFGLNGRAIIPLILGLGWRHDGHGHHTAALHQARENHRQRVGWVSPSRVPPSSASCRERWPSAAASCPGWSTAP